jgi:hypothetical protein
MQPSANKNGASGIHSNEIAAANLGVDRKSGHRGQRERDAVTSREDELDPPPAKCIRAEKPASQS